MERISVPGGTTETVPTNGITNLGDTFCFTVSIGTSHWYYHYEYQNEPQFGGFYNAVGYADAELDWSFS